MIRHVAAISVVLAAMGLAGCANGQQSKPLNAKKPTYYWTTPEDSTTPKKKATTTATSRRSRGSGWTRPRETAGK